MKAKNPGTNPPLRRNRLPIMWLAEARAAAQRALAIAPDYAAARQLLALLPE